MNYFRENKNLVNNINKRLEKTPFKIEVTGYQINIKKYGAFYVGIKTGLTDREKYLILSALEKTLFFGVFQDAVFGNIYLEE